MHRRGAVNGVYIVMHQNLLTHYNKNTSISFLGLVHQAMNKLTILEGMPEVLQVVGPSLGDTSDIPFL